MWTTVDDRVAHDASPERGDGRYVLYWMVATRRTSWSPALDRALAHARRRGLPLLVFEPLRAGYRWASRRHHQFVVQGMRDNAAACRAAGVTYLPYVEPAPGDGAGLLAHLAREAAVVVTDDAPVFFLRRMVDAVAGRLGVRLEKVDGVGVVPLRHPGRSFPVAHAFRRHVHKHPGLLLDRPDPTPLDGYDLGPAPVPALAPRWAAAELDALLAGGIERLPIDALAPVADVGGAVRGGARLRTFLSHRLPRYAEDRNHPDEDAQSGLSPWLHYGHVSAFEAVAAVLDGEGWTPARVRPNHVGQREGFWGLSGDAESFLDELITWRELGHVFAHHHPDLEVFETLPGWALATLRAHASDPREVVGFDRLDAARTPDPLWNAAQRQLRAEGRIHNYLRMLWGKKVLAWAPTPELAWDWLFELNNRYATDGRDPNSASGIAWTFGRFDRAWGPERPIYGTVRYMTSENTARKLHLKAYLRRWGQPGLL